MRVSLSCRRWTGWALLVAVLAGGAAAILIARREPGGPAAEKPREQTREAGGEGISPRPAVIKHVRFLSSLNRISGTGGCREAALYIRRLLEEWGLEVRTQEFDVVTPVTREMEFSVEGRNYRIYPLWPNWTRTSTTIGVLSGPLVYAGKGKLKDYRGLPMKDIEGSGGNAPIVLMEGDKGLDWFSAAMLGAQAIIFCQSEAINRVEMENKVSLLPANIPRFYCDSRTGSQLKEIALSAQQIGTEKPASTRADTPSNAPVAELRCRVDWQTRRTENIIAFLQGDGTGAKPVAFQAYYDSISTVPDIARGAESACGAAALLEMAREFSRRPPKRGAIFLFFSGHFESLQGAKEFFGVVRKTHPQWLEDMRSLEEQVLGTSALEGRSFFQLPQVSIGILAVMLTAALLGVWVFVRRRALGVGAGLAALLAVFLFSWALMLPGKQQAEGTLKIPKLEKARLALAPLSRSSPDAYKTALEVLSRADESIQGVLEARKKYEAVCQQRRPQEAEEMDVAVKPAHSEAAVEAVRELLEKACSACGTLAAYGSIFPALRTCPQEAADDVAAARKAVETLTAGDFSASRNLPAYLKTIRSLHSLEQIGVDLPERLPLIVSLDLSSHADTLALLFKGSFVEQHEKNYETTLSRCMAPAADISCSAADRLSPGMLVNCVVNPRGLHWTNYTGGKIATDNEMALLAGFPSCSIVSAYDARDLVDTPLDTFERIDRDRLSRQAGFLVEWALRFVDDPRTEETLDRMEEEALLSRERFLSISTRVVEYDMSRGMGVADKIVPDALVACYHDPGWPARYYNRDKLYKMIWGVREVELKFADKRGAVLFDGIPHAVARYWEDKSYTVEAYVFDPVTGNIVMAPDRGEQGEKKFVPTIREPKRENEFLTCVLFPCVDISIFDTLDQRSHYMFTHVEMYDAETDAEPFRYGYRITGRVGYGKSYIEPCAVLFVEPRSRFKVLFGGSSTGTKYSLINAPEATRRLHTGVGYEAAESTVITHTPYKMARDLWNLDEYRIENLLSHGVTNREVQELHAKARASLDAAEQAFDSKQFDMGVMRSREAWALEAQAYPKVRGTTSDMLRGVLFYLFLVLPFAYFTERLLFRFADINKQLAAFFGLFLLVFLVLSLVHPAFGVTNSSPVVLLAFVSVALSVLVLGMIRSRFELELSRLRRKPGASGSAKVDLSRIAAAKSAFMLGINNMRRRKVRTSLTLLTLVVLTFSVLSFTSMQPESIVLEHDIVNLEHSGHASAGELEPPLSFSTADASEPTNAFVEKNGSIESTGSIHVRDWLAVEGKFREDAPAVMELSDEDGDRYVLEFHPEEGYAAYALRSGGIRLLGSWWGLAAVVLFAVCCGLLFAGGRMRSYSVVAGVLAAFAVLFHFMPKGSAAGGVAPAELAPLGPVREHTWIMRLNPETLECMAVVDDRLVRRFRSDFLDLPVRVSASPVPLRLSVEEERRGIPWQGFLVRNAGWGAMTSQAYRYILDEFDPEKGNLVAPRAWWLLSQTEASATRITSADKPELGFLAQGLVGMTADEVHFTRPQDDLLAGRWLAPGAADECVLPQKIASACGITPERINSPGPAPQVLILGEQMSVAGITNDDLWAGKADIDTEPVSPVDYTVENWMKHSGRRRDPSEFYHYAHLSPLNVAYVPYSFLISRGGTLRSIAVKPAGGLKKQLKVRLLQKFSLPLFIASGDRVKYVSAAGAIPIKGVTGLTVPMLICALIVLNTMLGAVYERKREIWTFGTLGLTPVHIGSLFIAESILFAVMGTVLGYVLGQVVAKFVAMGWFLEGLSLNYSSTSAVFSAVFVMGVVIVSTIYPAMMASRMSVPDIERIWKFPEPEGDVLNINFPFTMGEEQALGVIMHLKEFLEEHADQSVGDFYTAGVNLQGQKDGEVTVGCNCWIAPFDFGISQELLLKIYPGDEPGMYEARMILKRMSGEPGSWARMNQRFLGHVRKQFLIWRMFTDEERAYYRRKTEKELKLG